MICRPVSVMVDINLISTRSHFTRIVTPSFTYGNKYSSKVTSSSNGKYFRLDTEGDTQIRI